MCGICDIINATEDVNPFTEEEMDRYLLAVYTGAITTSRLSLPAYKKVAGKLTDGVFKGYELALSDVLYLSEDYQMLRSLRENTYVFSAAKQYQQVRAMNKLLRTGDKVTPWNEFKKAATQIFTDYNQSYLRAEYNSAIGMSSSARQWQDFERDKAVLPYLKYVTAGDDRVRPTHAELNGITRKVDDAFWNKFMPPNGWNCRCDVQQMDEGKETDLQDFKTPDDVPDIFQFNPGKKKIVFSPKHPYFDVVPKDKDLARNNFNLPLPGNGI